jgi:hypothetical protein
MDSAISSLMSAISAGGDTVVVPLMLFICYGLWMDRTRLMKEQDQAEDRLDAVAQEQRRSTDEIVGALIDLRLARRDDPRKSG